MPSKIEKVMNSMWDTIKTKDIGEFRTAVNNFGNIVDEEIKEQEK